VTCVCVLWLVLPSTVVMCVVLVRVVVVPLTDVDVWLAVRVADDGPTWVTVGLLVGVAARVTCGVACRVTCAAGALATGTARWTATRWCRFLALCRRPDLRCSDGLAVHRSLSTQAGTTSMGA
jgi:hypothetical protein